MTRAIAIVMLAACSRGAGDSGHPPSPVVATTTPHQDASTMPITNWRARSIAAHGLTIDFVDGIDVTEGESAGQHYVLQRRDSVLAAIDIGTDRALAWWRSNFGERKLAFGAESAVTICGRTGARQEVSVPEGTATGLVKSGSGGIGHIYNRKPAEVHIAISGATNAGTPFVATWVVAADRRDELRADEDHFFGSIRCK